MTPRHPSLHLSELAGLDHCAGMNRETLLFIAMISFSYAVGSCCSVQRPHNTNAETNNYPSLTKRCEDELCPEELALVNSEHNHSQTGYNDETNQATVAAKIEPNVENFTEDKLRIATTEQRAVIRNFLITECMKLESLEAYDEPSAKKMCECMVFKVVPDNALIQEINIDLRMINKKIGLRCFKQIDREIGLMLDTKQQEIVVRCLERWPGSLSLQKQCRMRQFFAQRRVPLKAPKYILQKCADICIDSHGYEYECLNYCVRKELQKGVNPFLD